MTYLLIAQTQSVTGAVITIIALLLVAAIIGYFTAWFYAKSVYTPVIKKLEEEKEEHLRQISGLSKEVADKKSEIEGLNNQIAGLKKDLSNKEKEIKDLQTKTGS